MPLKSPCHGIEYEHVGENFQEERIVRETEAIGVFAGWKLPDLCEQALHALNLVTELVLRLQRNSVTSSRFSIALYLTRMKLR